MSAETLTPQVRFGIWELSLTDGTLIWSDELYRLFGYAPRSIPSTIDAFVSLVHPDDRSMVVAHLDRLRSGEAQVSVEHRIIRGDGSVRILQGTGAARRDEHGTPIRVIGTLEDITEDKERALRIVLSDRMRSVGTLAAGVAHEINNPLALISVNLDLMMEELRAHHQGVWSAVESMTHDARVGVDRIRNIVRGLKTFAHADEAHAAPLDVKRVIDLAIALANHEIRHRAKLVTDFAAVPSVHANEARLGQVFVNLLVNAAQSIPIGVADRNEIRVTTREQGGFAVVEIKDSGEGIPVDVQARIFDPFFTTKPVGEATGLGLSICHNIVRSLGGTITFTSTPDAGSVFCVSLPPANPVTTSSASTSTRPADKVRQRARLLIIDDEVMFTNSLRRLLSREHDVTAVNSGRVALDRLRAGERFDVILCDLMMPEIGGMDVHAELLRLAPEQASRMIFLTGGAFTAASQRFLDQGGIPYFEKPCDLQLLQAAIRRVTDS